MSKKEFSDICILKKLSNRDLNVRGLNYDFLFFFINSYHVVTRADQIQATSMHQIVTLLASNKETLPNVFILRNCLDKFYESLKLFS